ncbi:MAG: hypothetical protein ACJ763_15625, partial [Bdellovibrionia bacterium]
MSARHILMSALVFFTGAYGVTTAAAEKNSSVTALSEDIPQAVIALQKRLSDLQLVTAPCFPAEVAGIEPLICTDPIKAVCSSEASNDFLRQMSVAQFKIAFAEKVYRQIQAQLGKNPEDWLNEASQKGGPQAMQERTLELVGMSYEVTEKLLFGVLKEKGWSKDAVEKIIDKAKAIEISKISSGDSIHPNRV